MICISQRDKMDDYLSMQGRPYEEAFAQRIADHKYAAYYFTQTADLQYLVRGICRASKQICRLPKRTHDSAAVLALA